jgi:hypothetical protein
MADNVFYEDCLDSSTVEKKRYWAPYQSNNIPTNSPTNVDSYYENYTSLICITKKRDSITCKFLCRLLKTFAPFSPNNKENVFIPIFDQIQEEEEGVEGNKEAEEN